MDNLTPIYVTNILESGTAFGMREDTGESVFIPSSVSRAARLHKGDSIECKLLPNTHQPEKTPWFAVQAHNDDDVEEVVEETVWDIVKDGGVWNTRSVYCELYEGDVDTSSDEHKNVSNELNRLHRVGELSIAKLYRSADQEKSSAVLFASNFNDLMPEMS